MTCVSADWDIPNVRCERNPSCELWDEEMLLQRQERERERDRERAPPPPDQRRAIQPVHVHFFDPVDHVPHQQGRTEADLGWIRDPGRWSLTIFLGPV